MASERDEIKRGYFIGILLDEVKILLIKKLNRSAWKQMQQQNQKHVNINSKFLLPYKLIADWTAYAHMWGEKKNPMASIIYTNKSISGFISAHAFLVLISGSLRPMSAVANHSDLCLLALLSRFLICCCVFGFVNAFFTYRPPPWSIPEEHLQNQQR